ncbi:MAG: thioredoxin domain-containing protein [Xanthobacteraceae bacterium]
MGWFLRSLSSSSDSISAEKTRIFEEISKSLNGKVKIVKLNVDENPGVAAKYGIMSIPTLMMFKNGELASRQVGAAPKQKLEQWITASA